MLVETFRPAVLERLGLGYDALSRSATIAEPGCLLGAHTDAILAELGYDEAAIQDLRARKVVA